MTTINADISNKFKSAIKHSIRLEADGHENEVEVREDEDQSVKLQEIIDLLVAAGYFRARIKGLSSFDKVVGGMTWCIESCNVDVDVDLLFQENLTIGQKIALTEKIVSVLPKMNCPHRIEPHQIQGLDFIHIFPVIQWLVKTSMEYRQEMSEFVKLYAINQFNKSYETPQEDTKNKNLSTNINKVKEVYRPRRYYRRKNAVPQDIETRIQLTLLEYGYRGHIPTNVSNSSQEDDTNKELQIEQFMKGMAYADAEECIDFDVLNSEEKLEITKHYEALQAELKDGGFKTADEKRAAMLEQQTKLLEKQYEKMVLEKQHVQGEIFELSKKLKEINEEQAVATKSLKEMEVKEAEDPETLKKIEELIVILENLKEREQSFRENCKIELANLQKTIEETEKQKNNPELNKSKTSIELEEETEKLKITKLQIAKISRAIAALQRQLDEVPSRAELAQYQKRFLELYNQVSAKHRETKQYYTLYNTLDDTRLYIKKELTLLNSILDSYPEAMQSASGKDEFLRQFEAIVENVKQTKEKVEQKCAEERARRDQLSKKLLGLVEQQRHYVAAVRELGIECRKNEALLAQQSS